MSLNLLVFLLIAAVTLGAAAGVVAFKNIIHSALALILTFLGVAALYFQLDAGFIGMVQILVYAGAVSVLFVFAVMLVMDRDAEETNLANPRTRWAAAAAALLLTGGLGTAIWSSKWTNSPGLVNEDEVRQLAGLLLGDYVVAFETAAILLLIAVVGAIILAKGAGE
ncbi:MAG: NADH-quinone oxidoreductase subunit J [Syntrophomonadaceae bacterium]|nr:NADH-quinone oxidoreductase subunit J [Syntrophomonadaceae bacterium]MDD3022535.1 NADH-quinone oxidoreductase subunit J [Syntrophomonadaceae bacterium]